MTDEPTKSLPPPSDKEPQPPPNKRPSARILERSETHIQAYGGPLPPPALLKEFDNVVPGAAERIIRMAEQQADHRQFLEKTVITGDSKRASYGLFIGALVVLSVLGGAIFLIYEGHDWAGAAIAGLDLVALASVFVYGSISRRSERAQKAKAMKPDETSAQP
jgi:uncharacterized membrane protein